MQKAANALKELGVGTGDRVAIYMPMIPELPIAMLACARIGAPHTVVFGGFSADALASRIDDAQAKLLITADGGWRRGKAVDLKSAADAAVEQTSTIEHVLVVERVGEAAPATMVEGRDVWWHDIVERQAPDCPPVPVDSEHMLYLLYTSGTTAKPKGIMHTTAGYLLGASYTHEMVFDIKDDDVYWCAADIGWVTGHSYIVYGPLANGTTGVLYEGSPDTPTWERWWEIVEEYKVTKLYTAPTAIRAFMKQGEELPARHDLSSLKLLGSVGEPINPEAWLWYHEHIGGGRAPIVDTWWQTETGHILITPLPGVTATKPGSATFPFPGIEADVVDATGESVPLGEGGYLVLKRPWPGMLRGIYGDPERYKATYWSRFKGMYFAGDGARRDEDGYFWLLGRVDDVMNVSGHRISTIEVESALVDHPAVAEAAVVGKHDPVTRRGHLRLRHHARPASRPTTSWRPSCAPTWARSSGPSPSPSTCSSRPTCPRRARARSCGGCCATWPRGARWATLRRWPTSRSSTPSAQVQARPKRTRLGLRRSRRHRRARRAGHEDRRPDGLDGAGAHLRHRGRRRPRRARHRRRPWATPSWVGPSTPASSSPASAMTWCTSSRGALFLHVGIALNGRNRGYGLIGLGVFYLATRPRQPHQRATSWASTTRRPRASTSWATCCWVSPPSSSAGWVEASRSASSAGRPRAPCAD